MATQADVLVVAEPVRVTWTLMLLELGRLLGIALVMSLAIGLLFTVAAVALPAALVQ